MKQSTIHIFIDRQDVVVVVRGERCYELKIIFGRLNYLFERIFAPAFEKSFQNHDVC